MGKKKTLIEVDPRAVVGDAMVDLMNACFEHGKAAQRMSDAQTDFQIAERLTQNAASTLSEIIMKPTPKEIN
jgi:hypothetical protein